MPPKINLELAEAELNKGAEPVRIIIETSPSPGIAMVLSLFLPGLGQIYRGRLISGLAWMFFVACGYLSLSIGGLNISLSERFTSPRYFILWLPGLVLHLICLFFAGRTAKHSVPTG